MRFHSPRRLGALAAAIALLTFAASAQETQPTTTPEAASPPATASGEVAASFQGPVVVTTVGRADGTIVRVLAQRAGLDAELIEEIAAENLEGAGTLLVAMGGSTKGLGAAGIDATVELERGAAMLALVSETGLPVVGVHVGGEARRGELSDPFCELVVDHVDALVVKTAGNTDGFFNEVAERRDIPLVEVETNGAAIEAIGNLFN